MEFKGELQGFPVEVVEKMLERQVEQGNKRDISVFEEKILTSDEHGGFLWDNTIEGHVFWKNVLINHDFDHFFEMYPKSEKPQQDEKPMFKRGDKILVWDCDESYARERIGLAYIDGAKFPVLTVCINDEDKFKTKSHFDFNYYKKWKPLPEEYTLEEIAKMLGKKEIRIKNQ